MSGIKRMLMFGVMAIVASMALAVPAQASDLKATCVVDGEAKVTDKADPDYGVRLIGGKGSYTFEDTTLSCVGTSKGELVNTELDVVSSGTFENVVCGTGKAQGDSLDVLASTDGNEEKYDALLSDEKYSVDFTAANGRFWWHDSDKYTPDLKNPLNLDPDKDGNPDEKDYDYGGEVQLSESLAKGSSPGPNDPEGNCVKAFHVNAVVTIHES